MRNLMSAHQPRSCRTIDCPVAGSDQGETIEALTIGDGSVDVVVCLDVLGAVNDRQAARELYRVLRPGGILLAMVPIVEGWDDTFEEPVGSTPEVRLLYFGKPGRARYFGRDARERLAHPGFIVEEYTAVEPAVSRYGLTRGEKVFICSRPTTRRRIDMERSLRADMANVIDLPQGRHSA